MAQNLTLDRSSRIVVSPEGDAICLHDRDSNAIEVVGYVEGTSTRDPVSSVFRVQASPAAQPGKGLSGFRQLRSQRGGIAGRQVAYLPLTQMGQRVTVARAVGEERYGLLTGR